jgi:molybdopterin converting factor small subunit
VKIRLVVTGRGYHAADSLPDQWELPDGATVDDVIRMLVDCYGQGPGWSETSLIAVAGRHLGTVASHVSAVLQDGDEVTLIAPVAGG